MNRKEAAAWAMAFIATATLFALIYSREFPFIRLTFGYLLYYCAAIAWVQMPSKLSDGEAVLTVSFFDCIMPVLILYRWPDGWDGWMLLVPKVFIVPLYLAAFSKDRE